MRPPARVPGGPQVTRTHPPVKGKDATDLGAFMPAVTEARRALREASVEVSGSDLTVAGSYNVNFDKIERVLGYRVEKSPYEGIVEVKQALERGRIDDSIQTKTVHYYRYLLDAERLLQEVSYNGKVF